MLGRERQWRAEAEFKGFHAPHFPGTAFAFIRGKNDGCGRLSEDLRKALVERRHACARIHEEEADVCFCNGKIGLASHTRFEAVADTLLQSRRINHGEGEVAKACLTLAPVSGDAR